MQWQLAGAFVLKGRSLGSCATRSLQCHGTWLASACIGPCWLVLAAGCCSGIVNAAPCQHRSCNFIAPLLASLGWQQLGESACVFHVVEAKEPAACELRKTLHRGEETLLHVQAEHERAHGSGVGLSGVADAPDTRGG